MRDSESVWNGRYFKFGSRAHKGEWHLEMFGFLQGEKPRVDATASCRINKTAAGASVI
jgi:hypothetical protein